MLGSFDQICQQVTELLEKKIGVTNKIAELIADVALSKWVEEGAELHKDKTVCTFCGNLLSEKRMAVIHAHFDDESKKIEAEIDALISKLQAEIDSLPLVLQIDKMLFYASFHTRLDDIASEFSANDWDKMVKVVLTESNKDDESWHEIIGNKEYRKELAYEFKDEQSEFKIAIEWEKDNPNHSLPDDIEKLVNMGKLPNLFKFLSWNMPLFLAYYKFYIDYKKPIVSDVADLAMSSIYPYCDVIIVEKNQAEKVKQIKSKHSIMNNTEIAKYNGKELIYI